ncbi:hypothetical protein [Mesorhizobium sp. LNJC405B00]|uniref:hypothetical protein n=1 Tax=unclassified Mesorhizobium TaxID=325217 RepID=UPI0003CE8023|nr:hypothetical protein [Mesorhizobium sp. LNJC405B00]ESX95730.1 hypothetical protein X755_22370 [Mesorhizobium sp. LNJC405B00]
MSTFRDRIEATIEHLIAMLDAMDGDTDREPEPLEEQHDRRLFLQHRKRSCWPN